MYAVIKTGGKQHKVSLGDHIEIEKLELSVGDEVIFDEVIAFNNKKSEEDSSNIKVGTPFIEGAKVIGTVIKQGKLPKVKIFKFRRRKHSAKSMGHRQFFTEVEIKDFNIDR